MRCRGFQISAFIFRDIAETVTVRESASAQQATIRAIDVDAGIGHALISVRETIEFANDTLVCMIGIREEAIRHVRFSAMLSQSGRHRFSEGLETLFRTGEPVRLESELVTREGLNVPMTLSIASAAGPTEAKARLSLRPCAHRHTEIAYHIVNPIARGLRCQDHVAIIVA